MKPVLLAALFLAGCAGQNTGAPLPLYRCEHNLEFTARFIDGTAFLDAGRFGSDLLQLDAGGTGPGQTVYSNPRMRAEFGLGASGREAIVRYFLLPLVARCVRD